MTKQSAFFHNGRPKGVKLATLGAAAVAFTLIGILIASNLDLSTRSVANVATNVAETGRFPVAEHDGKLESPFVAVIEEVAAAVVNISARTRETDRPWWFYSSQYSTSLGSGFFFREDGYILTNSHVVNNAVAVTVRTSSGYEYEARLVGTDPQTDLAVIKVEPEEKVTVIPFGDSEEIKVGDWAIAIGNPFPKQGLDRTVTVGVVSAKGRSNLRFGSETPQYQNYIQTDASINPGNSGGPLLNLRGEAIGVNAAIASPTGTSIGIGFAIPINLARTIVTDLIATGHASRGWLGVWLSEVSEREAKHQGLDAVRGVRIDSVLSNSPAEQAGIEDGDIVVRFNGQEVLNGNQFSVLVSTVREGNTVPVEVVRNGKHISMDTMVGDRDTYLASTSGSRRSDDNLSELWLGMELIAYTPEIARAIGAKHVDGAYVVRVYPGTPAYRASIAEGTIILKVDNYSVKDLSDIQQLTRSESGRKSRIPLIVQEPDGTIARKVIRQ